VDGPHDRLIFSECRIQAGNTCGLVITESFLSGVETDDRRQPETIHYKKNQDLSLVGITIHPDTKIAFMIHQTKWISILFIFFFQLLSTAMAQPSDGGKPIFARADTLRGSLNEERSYMF